MMNSKQGKLITFLIAAVALLVLPLFLQTFGNAWVRIIDMALLFVLLALGLNIVVGYAGLLDLGYVAFYAVGAYSYALLGTTYGWSFWILLPAAGIMAAFWGVILGLLQAIVWPAYAVFGGLTALGVPVRRGVPSELAAPVGLQKRSPKGL